MDSEKEKENFNGIMVRYFKEIGKQERKMDQEYGLLHQVTAMKDNGLMVDNMELALISIKIVLIKESL